MSEHGARGVILVQRYVEDMCESVDHMNLTATKKEFAKAVIRAAINYANLKLGKASAVTSQQKQDAAT